MNGMCNNTAIIAFSCSSVHRKKISYEALFQAFRREFNEEHKLLRLIGTSLFIEI
ncbi:hypothetical protein APHMUC_0444 [Anaplasma phagocytophilum str. ApMUC09]|uniref:Uncharacterized protein n=1 Tax=Anaplasma phagocytophilum str. ApMUC09 TaxID=1359152 RepID=A0A0F3NAL1_ANAPH|nr:hypothetical protein APHMUC_0444 [Anaplasma phagocytophilum str. ApMUC09]